MATLNLKIADTITQAYSRGLLPQRNQKGLFYQESSSRSDLSSFELSSENRRIIRKTNQFTHQLIPLSQFTYTPEVQKQCFKWIKAMDWDFPISSLKTIFTNHIFNYVYVWKNPSKEIVAYSICYFDQDICHIAYVFYNPQYSHGDLPIRLVLQTIIDSHDKKLKYCYLGRFNPETKLGFYKRNMPGFEYHSLNGWQKYV